MSKTMIRLSKFAAAGVMLAAFSNLDNPQFNLPINEREKVCIVEALWHEARGESEQGIRAVLTVIQNRVYDARYPSSYCRVINQRKQFSYILQHRAKGKPTTPNPKAVEISKIKLIDSLATDALQGKLEPIVPQNALWYHTIQVRPEWSKKMRRVKVVGNHVFYTDKAKVK